MAIIKQQSNHNGIQTFGYTDNESINQSMYFERSLTLDSIVVDFSTVFSDPTENIEIKCQVRRGFKSDNRLNLNSSIVDQSAWYEDGAISVGLFSFVFNGLTLLSGHYWFTILTNQKCCPNEFSLRLYRGGEFQGKFIKIINGSGIYRIDQSLKFEINGSWIGSISENRTFEHDIYTTTTLKDTMT